MSFRIVTNSDVRPIAPKKTTAIKGSLVEPLAREGMAMCVPLVALQCNVVSTDYVPSLLEHSRTRAAAEGLSVEYGLADAEVLAFADATFDVVVSTFGVMFTPNQDKAALEPLRVCKSGGKIGLANWTPEGFIGQVFKILGSYLPPPAGVKSPALWGTRARITEMFGSTAASIKAEQRTFAFRYRSPEHFLEIFKTTTAQCSKPLRRSTKRGDKNSGMICWR
jgi:ubiquinone/menaquinone biosynthesis C-methylase UbiE